MLWGCEHEPQLVVAPAALLDGVAPLAPLALVDAGPVTLDVDERDRQVVAEYTLENAVQKAEELDEALNDELQVLRARMEQLDRFMTPVERETVKARFAELDAEAP
jgi:hypothetical protein